MSQTISYLDVAMTLTIVTLFVGTLIVKSKMQMKKVPVLVKSNRVYKK